MSCKRGNDKIGDRKTVAIGEFFTAVVGELDQAREAGRKISRDENMLAVCPPSKLS